MNKFSIVIFLLWNSWIYAQNKDVIYRIAFDSYPTVGYSYDVSILYLRHDNTYKILFQKYSSRKMARKNVLRSSNDELGRWKMSGDTLLLYDNNRSSMKFLKVSDKRIDFIIDDKERSRNYWKKVKY